MIALSHFLSPHVLERQISGPNPRTPQSQKHFEQQKHSHWRTCQWPSHGRYPNWLIDVIRCWWLAYQTKLHGVHQRCSTIFFHFLLQSCYQGNLKTLISLLLEHATCPPFLRQARTRPWDHLATGCCLKLGMQRISKSKVIHLSQWFSVLIFPACRRAHNSWTYKTFQSDHKHP